MKTDADWFNSSRGSTWCSCEVLGMILLRNFNGAMRLDRSKDMSVHVSAFASYDFNALTPVAWKSI
jgi:hypothetical protein